ncbi:hypothetical protein [Sutcliffiella horikoshii]|uniref:hypothetical protein n=1 Tax=Sutcliffiella horikoshii TaxID=79883 RepID=UPI001CFD2996|nr:hypothetical protein [Sutcliffiella horikoshii]
MKTSVTRKKEERGPRLQYEYLDNNEISFKWSEMKRKGKIRARPICQSYVKSKQRPKRL